MKEEEIMYRRVVFLISMLMLVSGASAVDWTDGDMYDSYWENGNNWSSGLKPQTTEIAVVNNIAGGSGAVLHTTETIHQLQVGTLGTAGPTGTVNITTGTNLTATDPMIIGHNYFAYGQVLMDDGVVNNHGEIWISRAGLGKLKMTGGTINSDNATYLGQAGAKTDMWATLQLYGGTINCTDLLTARADTSRVTMNVTGGEMILNNDRVTQVQAYVAAGWLRGYGVADLTHVIITYDSDNNKTHITAVPEPATVLMLGLGGLALIRRKRR